MSSKHSLILLHGALGSEKQFAGLHEWLIADFDIHTFNFSGHGGLPLSAPFSMEHFSDDLTSYIRQHGLQQPHIFGYSMGGYVALHVARHDPGLLNRIITLGTKMKWDPTIAAHEIKMLNPEVIEQKVPAFATALQGRHAPEDWKQNMQATASMMIALGNGSAMSEADLQSIPNDILLCLGEEDNMVTREETIWAAHHLVHGRYKIIPGFKHPIDVVDMKVLASLISEFLHATIPYD